MPSQGDRDLQAVNVTTVIILLAIVVPSFRKIPMQILGLGLVVRNDEKVAHLDEWLWSSLPSGRLYILWQRARS